MTDPSATQIGPEGFSFPSGPPPAISGYDLVEELGRGGMGVVYRARHQSTGRDVALKILRNGALAGGQERSRFRLEAESAARLRHPGVVAIEELGLDAALPYFVMELIDGGSLDRTLAGRPQQAEEAAQLIRALAGAVQAAHELQIIHRDLKPANILLRRPSDSDSADPGGGAEPLPATLDGWEPMIADFGLAKRLDAESTAWTQDGAILGTASYMAPEQAAGRVREIGPAADIYSLGAILYELLTGVPPFKGETWSQTVALVLNQEPTPPGRLERTVPQDIETICLKCLEKDPLERYGSAADLAGDLDRFLAGKGIVAQPLPREERIRRLALRDDIRLVSEIGRGPGSVVYRALFGPLQQTVAVKVFDQATRDDDWEPRFRGAADSWSVLSHPQVIVPQRSGTWDGSRYLVLDHVPLGSLAASAGTRRPIRQVLEILHQLTEIVSYLHRQGVIHGNLKATNVLVAAGGIPRLTDFHPTGTLEAGLPDLHDGLDPAAVGTLAPERLSAPRAELRIGTDLYGLGVVLYELLAGRPPFLATSARETAEQVLTVDPQPPSVFNRDVPPGLDWVCLRCLVKSPARRFARAYELQTRLQRVRDNLDSAAPPRPARTGRA